MRRTPDADLDWWEPFNVVKSSTLLVDGHIQVTATALRDDGTEYLEAIRADEGTPQHLVEAMRDHVEWRLREVLNTPEGFYRCERFATSDAAWL